ncbi:glycosyltransferase family 4 protein [Pseudaestuariivita atlantica]|uniref:Glycosyl transferase family 1 domain-containing protein n=1 Tax=Pseudaestuariivita atlantica TaxID=1317121 RepID=A0A0L1JNL3_9RHOB|nr:glycosyltransferase family 1 protein [Pseudaestuariivita atlantica]KNG93346.1 hypothetical protein ATO11_12960 [Pseudaestuariivita atlantica]
MPGDGTKLATTPNNAPPPARLLDVTRLIRRAGHRLTGVDRVEFAYLERLAIGADPAFGLVRTPMGYLLLDKQALCELVLHVRDDAWDALPFWSRLAPPANPGRRRAERTARRLASARALPARLGQMLRQYLPAGTAYLNTGHSNFTARVIRAVRSVPGARIAVLVHDTIPLDHPEFQRDGTVVPFKGFLARVADHADLVIANSDDTARSLPRHMARVPPVVTALLGADLGPPRAEPAADPPHFVTLGTIEPRKNHALLLDVWDALPDPKPTLHVLGRRGWKNEDVFARLDARPAGVVETEGMGDADVADLIASSAGFLFPSHAEGFGLPPLEAAQLGVPVVCADLPVYREFLGDIPVYAKPDDRYAWSRIIEGLTKDPGAARRAHLDKMQGYSPPTWDAHFKIVLSWT